VLSEVKTLGDGSDKEIEGFFNLLYSHLFTLYPIDSPETSKSVSTLLHTIASSSSDASIKYRILSNLYNSLPRTSPLRLATYESLLALAKANNELSVLQLTPTSVQKTLKEWTAASAEEKTAFLKSIVEAYEASGQPEIAYTYSLLYISSLPPSSSSSEALQAIATALSLPTLFDFDPLFKLDAVVATKAHPLFALLQIFLNDGLIEYKKWEAENAGVLDEFKLDKVQLERKIRLLTLASLGFQNIGKDLSYAKIAEALQVEEPEVEKWVIDVIRTSLLSGKLSQPTSTLHITRSTARSFEHAQWEALEKRLLAWKGGLLGVLEVVKGASAGPTGGRKNVVGGGAVQAQAQSVGA